MSRLLLYGVTTVTLVKSTERFVRDRDGPFVPPGGPPPFPDLRYDSPVRSVSSNFRRTRRLLY